MAKKPLPTQDLLRQLFNYDPHTGVLTWKERPLHLATGRSENSRIGGCKIWNKRYAGKEAGGIDQTGYRGVKIYNQTIHAHRIIWCWVHGEWAECIDHINGNPLDNRICNLRSVTREINQRNQKLHKSNTSGRAGVSWNRFTQKWVAQVGHRGSSIYLGSYDDFEVAVIARSAAEKVLGFTGRV